MLRTHRSARRPGHPRLRSSRSPSARTPRGPSSRAPRSGYRLPGVEDMRSRGLYPGLHVVPGPGVRPHVHRVPTPGLAYGLTILGAAVADVDLLDTAHLALVAREGVLLDGPQHLQKAPLHHLRRHRVSEPGGLGVPPRGELEDVGRIKSAVLHQPEGVLVVLFCLSRVPHDDVRAYSSVRDCLPEHSDLAPEPL